MDTVFIYLSQCGVLFVLHISCPPTSALPSINLFLLNFDSSLDLFGDD